MNGKKTASNAHGIKKPLCLPLTHTQRKARNTEKGEKEETKRRKCQMIASCSSFASASALFKSKKLKKDERECKRRRHGEWSSQPQLVKNQLEKHTFVSEAKKCTAHVLVAELLFATLICKIDFMKSSMPAA